MIPGLVGPIIVLKFLVSYWPITVPRNKLEIITLICILACAQILTATVSAVVWPDLYMPRFYSFAWFHTSESDTLILLRVHQTYHPRRCSSGSMHWLLLAVFLYWVCICIYVHVYNYLLYMFVFKSCELTQSDCCVESIAISMPTHRSWSRKRSWSHLLNAKRPAASDTTQYYIGCLEP